MDLHVRFQPNSTSALHPGDLPRTPIENPNLVGERALPRDPPHHGRAEPRQAGSTQNLAGGAWRGTAPPVEKASPVGVSVCPLETSHGKWEGGFHGLKTMTPRMHCRTLVVPWMIFGHITELAGCVLKRICLGKICIPVRIRSSRGGEDLYSLSLFVQGNPSNGGITPSDDLETWVADGLRGQVQNRAMER